MPSKYEARQLASAIWDRSKGEFVKTSDGNALMLAHRSAFRLIHMLSLNRQGALEEAKLREKASQILRYLNKHKAPENTEIPTELIPIVSHLEDVSLGAFIARGSEDVNDLALLHEALFRLGEAWATVEGRQAITAILRKTC